MNSKTNLNDTSQIFVIFNKQTCRDDCIVFLPETIHHQLRRTQTEPYFPQQICYLFRKMKFVHAFLLLSILAGAFSLSSAGCPPACRANPECSCLLWEERGLQYQEQFQANLEDDASAN
ncbi:hypothetical protein CDAR_214381 [Caerostris darwini]|uniref:Uncharacterized protein n=1 Tax=Caerostris darwini TaxID=1538125 RepID=A0AAV4R1I0_9ARAC|nr:hypothetical protein CDAR_214381 [Caerostris darwini]